MQKLDIITTSIKGSLDQGKALGYEANRFLDGLPLSSWVTVMG